jgi:16S rRNA G966 N2-methylase RsmD
MDDDLYSRLLTHYTTGGKVTAEKIRIAKTVYNITEEQAQKDLDTFMKKNNVMAGLKFLNYYFAPYRLDTKSKKKISFYEFYHDKALQSKPYVKRLLDKAAPFQVFSLYFGSISQFKPSVAYDVYSKLKPTTILDISAGWGGRCLGAIKYGANYIGFDTNTELRKPYSQMLKAIPNKPNVKLIFKDSSKVDFSRYSYDMVFTSPPYFTIEKYENMPTYDSFEGWVQVFLKPVVEKSYQHMKQGGKFCLNVPEKIYDECKKILGRASDDKIPLHMTKRQEGVINYHEYIYIWSK